MQDQFQGEVIEFLSMFLKSNVFVYFQQSLQNS